MLWISDQSSQKSVRDNLYLELYTGRTVFCRVLVLCAHQLELFQIYHTFIAISLYQLPFFFFPWRPLTDSASDVITCIFLLGGIPSPWLHQGRGTGHLVLGVGGSRGTDRQPTVSLWKNVPHLFLFCIFTVPVEVLLYPLLTQSCHQADYYYIES